MVAATWGCDNSQKGCGFSNKPRVKGSLLKFCGYIYAHSLENSLFLSYEEKMPDCTRVSKPNPDIAGIGVGIVIISFKSHLYIHANVTIGHHWIWASCFGDGGASHHSLHPQSTQYSKSG